MDVPNDRKNTAMKVMRVTDSIRAAAVPAERLGLRRALSRPRVPATPNSRSGAPRMLVRVGTRKGPRVTAPAKRITVPSPVWTMAPLPLALAPVTRASEADRRRGRGR